MLRPLTAFAITLVVGLTSLSVLAQPTVKPRTVRPAATRAAPAPVPPPVIPRPADDDQREAVKLTHLGHYHCEFGQSLEVVANPTYEAYVDVKWNKQVLVMKPVLSSTGVLRLEDVTGRTLMIQIAQKSMLMDTQIGRRLVDECLHEVQRVAKEEAAKRPAESSIGIDPARAAAAATAAATAATAAAATAAAAAVAATDAAAVADVAAAAAKAAAAQSAAPSIPATAPSATLAAPVVTLPMAPMSILPATASAPSPGATAAATPASAPAVVVVVPPVVAPR